jgi:hypothetical protein
LIRVIGSALSAATSGSFAALGSTRHGSSKRSQGIYGNIFTFENSASRRWISGYIRESWRIGDITPAISTTEDSPAPCESKTVPRHFVLAAVPGADASKTLSALKRYRWVAQSASGVITLRADGFLARGMPRGPLLNASLASLDALTDTCYASLRGRRPMPPLSHLQRSAYTDHFDREHLRGYEEFLNESSQVFLAMHEAWLKRHEVKTGGRCKRLSHVGVGVFAIRDR